MSKGIILKGVGGLYTVSQDGRLYNCSARGIFRKDDIAPVAGDYVELQEVNDNKHEAVINKIYERKNLLIRPNVANVDQIITVIAMVSPKPDLLLIDKLIATAMRKGINPVLVINKIDQDPDAVNRLYNEYRYAVKDIITTCAIKETGIDKLKEVLKCKISVMCGQSGVGKSSLLNRILEAAAMQTGELSSKINRGKQTTRHAEMFPLKDHEGYIIDSPGFSLYDLTDMAPGELQNLYPEVYNVEGCRFQDCSHTGEPGCCVQELVNKGTFPKGRYERYVEIYKELKKKELNKYR